MERHISVIKCYFNLNLINSDSPISWMAMELKNVKTHNSSNPNFCKFSAKGCGRGLPTYPMAFARYIHERVKNCIHAFPVRSFLSLVWMRARVTAKPQPIFPHHVCFIQNKLYIHFEWQSHGYCIERLLLAPSTGHHFYSDGGRTIAM